MEFTPLWTLKADHSLYFEVVENENWIAIFLIDWPPQKPPDHLLSNPEKKKPHAVLGSHTLL